MRALTLQIAPAEGGRAKASRDQPTSERRVEHLGLYDGRAHGFHTLVVGGRFRVPREVPGRPAVRIPASHAPATTSQILSAGSSPVIYSALCLRPRNRR